MALKTYILKLHKKSIVSEKPNPIVPFLLFFVFFFLLIPSITLAAGMFFILLIAFLALFSLVFAILHLIVWLILKNKLK